MQSVLSEPRITGRVSRLPKTTPLRGEIVFDLILRGSLRLSSLTNFCFQNGDLGSIGCNLLARINNK